jgi:predicted P-loop ATPase
MRIYNKILNKKPRCKRGFWFDENINMTVINLPSRHTRINQKEPQPFKDKVRNTHSTKQPYSATITSVNLVIRDFISTGIEIRFDSFRDEIMFSETNMNQWRPFRDEDYTSLRIKLEGLGLRKVGRELVRDAVYLVAKEHIFDSANEWLSHVVPSWDFELRIDTFLHVYFGVVDTPYTRAVSSYLWSSLAGRVLYPAIKADMVPILIGEQGAGKSTGVAAICPHSDFFTEISFNEKEDDLARKMRGRLLAEISELRGLNTRDVESIKAFVTRTHETWTPKFKEFSTTYPRRIVFIGTTNKQQFLADQTGNRRWLPVTVGKVNVEKIRQDCLQLWAEARDTYTGIEWAKAERLAKENHGNHMIVDPWQEIVHGWLLRENLIPSYGADIAHDSFVTTNQVLLDAIKLEARAIDRRSQMRMADVLYGLGFVKGGSRRINGQSKNIFIYQSLADGANTLPTPKTMEVYPF